LLETVTPGLELLEAPFQRRGPVGHAPGLVGRRVDLGLPHPAVDGVAGVGGACLHERRHLLAEPGL
jgi:hypothetical protein